MTKYRDQATRFGSKRSAISAARKAEEKYPYSEWEIRKYWDDGFYVLFINMPQSESGITHAWL